MRRKRDKTSFSFCCKERLQVKLDGQLISLTGNLTVKEAAELTRQFLRHLRFIHKKALVFDLSGLVHIDSAGVMALYYIRKKLSEKSIQSELRDAPAAIADKIRLFYPDELAEVSPPRRPAFFEHVGGQVYHFFFFLCVWLILLAANIFYWGITDIFKPRARRKGEFVNQAVLIGVNAVLIVVFLTFVIGYVIALHSAGQLRTFGANIFVVDLVVFSILSQMGPLITAILVAGRSGSAIAAEIATMKVTAELDALKTMGLNPNRFVVVPKLYACMLTMPFLIVFANVAGIFGGGLAANVYLDITPEVFINRMMDIMRNKELWVALVKSQVYAALIVLTGSFYGFRVERGAEGVGKVTTVAVVVSITLVIVADSLLGVIFY